MKKYQLISALVVSSSISLAFAGSWQSDITKLAQQSLPSAQIGVMVIDANNGQTLYDYNADKAFTPASTLKLFSGAAALRYLGADYIYDTTISYNPRQIENGVLHGNIYIKFSGDPSLKTSDLQRLVAAIREHGIRSIQGNVVVDNSRFQEPDHAPGWTNDSLYWAYSAPISSVILDKNYFTVNFIPNKHIGSPVIIQQGKNMQYMQLQSSLRTVTYAQSMHDCSIVMDIDNQNTLRLGGCWPDSMGGWKTMAVPNPTLLAERVIERSLHDQQVSLHGEITVGKQPNNLTIIADHQSAPFSKLLKHMMKQSDNIYAGSVTKTLGSMSVGQGSFLQGVNTIKQILRPLTGINFGNTVISDGSGQSRYDLITPQQFTQLLYGIYHTPSIQMTFMNALPTSGIDGTLKFRMGSNGMIGKVHAKTGSMKGISTLAGYLTTADGHTIIFAIMINNIVGKLHAARVVEDKMCGAMYRI